MSLSDPTSGAGYSFGEQLPSAHMSTIATQQPDALDIANGGTYTMAGAVTISAASAQVFKLHTNTILQCTGGALLDGGATFGSGASVVGSGVEFQWSGSNGTDLPKITSRQYRFTVPLVPIINDSDRFSWATASSHWGQSNITSAGALVFAVPGLPGPSTGYLLRDIVAWVDGGGGASGDHGGLPATLPTIVVRRVQHGVDTQGQIGTATDPSGTQGAYDIPHTISIVDDGGGAMDDDPDASSANNSSYYVTFTGEASTNAQADSLRLRAIDAICTVEYIGP